MIKTYYKEEIISTLAAIINYGINKQYSFKVIEENIVYSSFICDLEDNKYDLSKTIEDIIKETYKVDSIDGYDISFKSLFLAESYINLFFSLNKSFEYIFLYIPLKDLYDKYHIYHEMDFSNLKNDIDILINKTSLLSKLSKYKNIKLKDISKLTGINENTIDLYSRGDEHLYKASFINIYKLSKLFNVKLNLFASKIDVYIDDSIYKGHVDNQTFLNNLGMYFASYYDNRINNREFIYDPSFNCFISKDGDIKLKVMSKEINDRELIYINNHVDENTYLVLFPFGVYNPSVIDSFIARIEAYEVLFIASDKVIFSNKNIVKELTNTINKHLFIKAKNSLN